MKVSDSLLFCIAISDAAFIAPIFLYKLFFVIFVFSVLGSFLWRCAVFHVFSSIDENKNESYREQQENQSKISNKSRLWSLT